jgi:hypothetical protein
MTTAPSLEAFAMYLTGAVKINAAEGLSFTGLNP